MPNPSIPELEAELERYIDELYTEFLADWIPAEPADQPQQFQHQVKAYCVLAHAAFEEFIEVISLSIMESAINIWLTERRPTDALLALCMFYKADIVAVDDEGAQQDRSFDGVRKAIERAKVGHSKAIFENHGFSLMYLRRALTPIFIDVLLDAREAGSLRTLADARGSYAHSAAKSGHFVDNKKAQRPMTPEGAHDIVTDCLSLCKKIAAEAIRQFPP